MQNLIRCDMIMDRYVNYDVKIKKCLTLSISMQSNILNLKLASKGFTKRKSL